MLSYSRTVSSDLWSRSVNDQLPCNVFPHSILVSRGRHASLDRRRYGMPKQQLRVRSDAACRNPVCWRWVRQSFVIYLTHLWDMSRVGKSRIMGLHGYGRGRDVVGRRVCGCRNVFMITAVSASSRCRLDPDDSFLFGSRTKTGKSDQGVDEDNACEK